MIVNDILPICEEDGWSHKSTVKLLEAFGAQHKTATLGVAIFESNVVAKGGKLFAEGC